MRGIRSGGSVALAVAVLAAGGGAGAAGAAEPGAAAGCALPDFGPGDAYRPVIHPRDFRSDVTNPFFPLRPGTTLVYTGTKDGRRALDLMVTSARTRVIDGVRTRVVEDRLYLDGVLEERTRDYYAQDRCGDVWYFGEDTATLDARGRVVSTEGSWHSGVGGARAGVFMEAHPRLGVRFRQEWSKGQAEDTFAAIDLSVRVTVPFGRFRHALRTEETSDLEPGVLDDKVYVRGVGEVAELSVRGPREELRLVDVIS